MDNTDGISFGTSFLDMLFITMFGFAALFVLSFLLINPVKKDHVLETKAEFVVIITWPTNMPHDVDTWIEDPSGGHVSFRTREYGLMHLDRDDQGKKGDSFIDPNGDKINFPYNREVTSIRGIFSGEYAVNVHFYSIEYYETGEYQEPEDLIEADTESGYAKDRSEDIEIKDESTYPVEVTVRLDKINPYKTVIERKVTLHKKGDEETAFRFIVGRDGRVISTSTLKKHIATQSPEKIEERERRRKENLRKQQEAERAAKIKRNSV